MAGGVANDDRNLRRARPAPPGPAPYADAMPHARVGPPVPTPATGGRLRVRRTVNWINLSTALGLLLAVGTRGRVSRGPHALYVVRGSGLRRIFPHNSATTIGDVVFLFLPDDRLARRPHLLDHEAMHAGQWAYWIGPFGFLPAYAVCSLYSWARTGNPALRNRFEVRASLLAGGYIRSVDQEIPSRRTRRGRRGTPV